MSARATITGNIRRALGQAGDDAGRAAAVAERLRQRPTGVIPARGQLPHEEQISLFMTMAERAAATTERLEERGDVPAAVARYLRDHNLPAVIRHGDDPRLAGLDWASTHVDARHGPAVDEDTASLSHAAGGVAETGTLMMLSGQDNPTTLNFLPPSHLVVLQAADIEGDYEAAWARIRSLVGEHHLPRTVNMITGPSRSADIQQTILMGAHGPKTLHILVVG